MSTTAQKIKVFGAVGIPSKANQFPLQPDHLVKIGQAIGIILTRQAPPHTTPKVVIGKDTRLSGYMLEIALISGLLSTGLLVLLVSHLPKPGVGFITSNMRAALGIVISASHNPFYDNGITIIGPDGYKISDAMEAEIEHMVSADDFEASLARHENVRRSRRIEDAQGRYIVYVKNSLSPRLHSRWSTHRPRHRQRRSYKIAPAIFSEPGAEVILIGNAPNEVNINDACGALSPDVISEALLKYRADAEISLGGNTEGRHHR